MADRIEEIKARLLGRTFSVGGVSPWHHNDIEFLLAEISRLRAASPSEERLAQLEAVTEAATKVVSHDEGEGQCEDRDGNRYDQPSVCADGEFCREADRRYEALRTAVLAALRTTKEGKGA